MRVRGRAAVLVAIAATLSLALAAAGSGSTEAAAAIPGCTPGALALKTPGTLTLATDNPAPRPWWNGTPTAPWRASSPATGKGYESAVAYAVAKRLGFPKRKVSWMSSPDWNVMATSRPPGTKRRSVAASALSRLPSSSLM